MIFDRLGKKLITAMSCVILISVLLTGCTLPNPREKDELSYRTAGIKQMNKGDYNQALSAFQKALDNSNGRISDVELDICYYKAYCLIRVGKNEEALSVYDAIIDYDKNASEAYLLRGHLYAALDDKDAALKDYNKAISLNPRSYSYCLAAYQNLMYAGDINEAEDYLRTGLEIKAGTAEEYCYQGRFYLLLKEYDAAKLVLSKAMNEGSEEAKLYMAAALREMGQEEQAYGIYENYVKSHNDDAEALYQIVSILTETGEYEKAISYADAAIDAAKNDNEKKKLMENKIYCLEKLYMYKEAINAVRTYLKTYPDDQVMAKELIFLNSRIGSSK